MKYILICPYFGRLPNNFQLWLNSCKYNTQFSFLIFTDDEREFIVPSNVIINRLDFATFVKAVQNKFCFEIKLFDAYKLCDLKPMYGYIFEEYIKGYDYWGHCDIDVIWGNLNKFIPKEKYDKINFAAHMALYKNCEHVNKAFMDETYSINYKHVLKTPNHLAFDEIGQYGINMIFIRRGLTIYNYESHIANVSPLSNNLYIAAEYDAYDNKIVKNDKRKRIFTFENGTILGWTCCLDGVEKTEYAYIHLQKRKMVININGNDEKFLICPHSYEDYTSVITPELIDRLQKKGFYFEKFIIKYKAAKRKFKRISTLLRIRITQFGDKVRE